MNVFAHDAGPSRDSVEAKLRPYIEKGMDLNDVIIRVCADMTGGLLVPLECKTQFGEITVIPNSRIWKNMYLLSHRVIGDL